jgi:DNA polymerase III subunit alpha
MAAVLTSVKDDKDRKPYYLYACRGMGIEVLPPDVNESDMDFAPAPGDRRAIRFGLSAVRNVGGGVVQGILEARATGGPFTSFADFCRRVEPTSLTKRVIESLIFAGAFDSLGYTRGGMLQQVGEQPAFEKVAAPIIAERKAEAAGQFSLFGGGADAPLEVDESVLAGDELAKRLLLSKEKEMLGQFVTDHPLLGVEDQLGALTTCQIPELDDRDDGDLVVLGGIIGHLSRKFTKRGEPYAQFRLEGLTGGVEVVAFPSVYEGVPELFEPDRIILVTGRIDRRGRELQIRASDVSEPALGPAASHRPGVLVVDLPAAVCSPGVLAKLKTLLEGAPGEVPVRLRFLSSDGVQPLSLGAYTVNGQGSLLDELRHLLGPSAARLEHETV